MQLVGLAEIAELLQVRAGTVAQWRHRGLLPPPTAELRMGPVWTRGEIELWATQTGRTRGDDDGTQ